jgi:S1-C subfamily serine protease
MRADRLKNALVIAVGLALAGLGVANLVLKASFTLMDDGAFWRQTAQGLVATRVAPGGPADHAGVRTGDVLVAVDGEEALSPSRLESLLAAKRAGQRSTYTLLRESERRVLDLVVQPLARGNVSAFYYLSLAGFFCLVVGTVVLW